MNELMTIINLAIALSKSYRVDITRLDIRYDEEEDKTQAYLHLDGHDNPDYKISEDGAVEVVKEKAQPAEESGLFNPPTFSKDERQQAIDMICRKEEEARRKLLAEMPPKTVAEALGSMKASINDLKVPTKPKALTVVPEGRKRPKDRQEKILKMYKEGWTKVKMAEELGVGLSTINYHIQALRKKGKI